MNKAGDAYVADERNDRISEGIVPPPVLAAPVVADNSLLSANAFNINLTQETPSRTVCLGPS
jgi:hypothetical protein